MSLEQLLQWRPDLWRGRGIAPAAPVGIPSRFAELDRQLPWGGWPRGALVEILSDGGPAGPFALVIPALAALSGEGRWVLLIDPPYLPYAPALAWRGVDLAQLLLLRSAQHQDAAWAAEQGLRTGACGAVLIWAGGWKPAALRRLQLAAETGGALAWLFRGARAAAEASPAALRLEVAPSPSGVTVRILKQRGGWPGPAMELSLRTAAGERAPADPPARTGSGGPPNRPSA